MPLRRIIFLFLGLFATAFACDDCGGKLKATWSERESEPKASVLYPDAKIVEYTLDVTEALLAPAGKPVRALALNGTVPGPTLRFREGEIARIHVRNRLSKEETSTHWHGLLLPNLEDGVPYVTTPPIKAGECASAFMAMALLGLDSTATGGGTAHFTMEDTTNENTA